MSFEIIVFTNARPQPLSNVMEMQTVYYAHQIMPFRWNDVSVGTLALNLTLTLVLHPLFLAVFISDAGTLLCSSRCPLFSLACVRAFNDLCYFLCLWLQFVGLLCVVAEEVVCRSRDDEIG
jgi:hypothetical protein